MAPSFLEGVVRFVRGGARGCHETTRNLSFIWRAYFLIPSRNRVGFEIWDLFRNHNGRVTAVKWCQNLGGFGNFLNLRIRFWFSFFLILPWHSCRLFLLPKGTRTHLLITTWLLFRFSLLLFFFLSAPSSSRLRDVFSLYVACIERLDSAHAGLTLESPWYCEGPLEERR